MTPDKVPARKRTRYRTLAIILGGGKGTRLYPLTKLRAKPAVPLGGKYRLIDVPISNCLNSGINQMYVLTQFESASLHRHVEASYRFDRFGSGFVELLAAQQRFDSDNWYQGTADAVRQNLIHFGEDWDEVLILSGDQLYHMDFQDLLGQHRASGADITISVLPVDANTATACGIMQLNSEARVVGFREKPPHSDLPPLATAPELYSKFGLNPIGRPYVASMGIYVFNKELLYNELRSKQHVDFGKNLFPSVVESRRVMAYIFDGYWEDIGTVGAFHEANLLMGRIPAPFSFLSPRGLVYTRPRTLPATVAESIKLKQGLIAEGCRVQDLTLEQSILGLRSTVGKNVRLKRTLVMGADYYESADDREHNRSLGRPDVGFGDNIEIENAIVDKNARIGSDVVIKNPDRVNPIETPMYVVRDGVICILKDAVIPSGTRIGV